jgi:hypothetical protein
MSRQIVPQLGDQNELVGRRKALDVWMLLKNHGNIIAVRSGWFNREDASGGESAMYLSVMA